MSNTAGAILLSTTLITGGSEGPTVTESNTPMKDVDTCTKAIGYIVAQSSPVEFVKQTSHGVTIRFSLDGWTTRKQLVCLPNS